MGRYSTVYPPKRGLDLSPFQWAQLFPRLTRHIQSPSCWAKRFALRTRKAFPGLRPFYGASVGFHGNGNGGAIQSWKLTGGLGRLLSGNALHLSVIAGGSDLLQGCINILTQMTLMCTNMALLSFSSPKIAGRIRPPCLLTGGELDVHCTKLLLLYVDDLNGCVTIWPTNQPREQIRQGTCLFVFSRWPNEDMAMGQNPNRTRSEYPNPH